MPTTRADLERMYDGPIPAEELARCVEPRAPRTPTEWARWTVRQRIRGVICARHLLSHRNAIVEAGMEAAARIELAAAWLAYRSAQADERMVRAVDANLASIHQAFALAAE